MDIVTIDSRRCKVQVIPGDGNCLFSAVAHQPFKNDPSSIMHIALTRTLREMAVDYIRVHSSDIRFSTLLQLRIRDEFPDLLRQYARRRIPAFLDILRTDRVWGASESLLALSSIFECDIVIYRENGFCTTVTADSATHRDSIAVVFRGRAASWNHYDSFMGLVNQADPASVNNSRSEVLWSTVNFTS